jgi:hypothetical protein
MRSVRPEGAAGSRLRAVIEEFPRGGYKPITQSEDRRVTVGCDIVVTDRKAWDVTKKRAHLDKEFNTEIFCSLDDLAAHLNL